MYDIPKVILDYENESFKANLSLYHTINVITGDSGVGKTYFCSKLNDLLDEGINPLKNGYSLRMYTLRDFTVESISDGKFLYVIDDSSEAVYAKGFFKKAVCMREAVFLILARELDQGSFSLDCFTEAVYKISFTESKDKVEFNIEKLNDI